MREMHEVIKVSININKVQCINKSVSGIKKTIIVNSKNSKYIKYEQFYVNYLQVE